MTAWRTAQLEAAGMPHAVVLSEPYAFLSPAVVSARVRDELHTIGAERRGGRSVPAFCFFVAGVLTVGADGAKSASHLPMRGSSAATQLILMSFKRNAVFNAA